MTLAAALRTSAFWTVTTGTTAFSFIHTAVFFCLVPIYRERGLMPQDAAITLMVFAVTLAVTQLAGGILADLVRPARLLFLGLAGLAAAMMTLLAATDAATAHLAGALLGASQGLFFGTTHPLWARYFGRRHLGKIRGVLVTINVAASSLGPLVAGVSHDLSGDFVVALAAFVLLPLPVALLSLWVAPPAAHLHNLSPRSSTAGRAMV